MTQRGAILGIGTMPANDEGGSVMRRKLSRELACGLTCAVLCGMTAFAQSPPNPNYVRQEIFSSYQEFKNELLTTVGIVDPTARNAAVNSLWSTLRTAGQVPYAQDDQVAFLYRGSASSVSWPGDFNGWNAGSASWQGTQFPGTDLWIVEKSFPTDARLDYKVVLNGSNYILDPANPLQMWGGFGPNNELRMPEYVFPQETVRQASVPRGTLTSNVTTFSSSLGYSVNHRVYTPAGYDTQNLSDLPVVYVTDGHEYAADHLGSMVVVLDNLIASGELRPTMAVFIDPRDPSNQGNNRRFNEYNMNPNFANFVANELVPTIDGNFRTDATSTGRTILGTSMGGLNAAYFGAVKGDVFQKIAPQSPAYNVNSAIYSLYQNKDLQFLDIFQTNGTFSGDGSGANQMANVWTANDYAFTRTITNEGHSWGQWRGLLDDVLIGLIGPSPFSADFDNDVRVNASDLAVWQGAYGTNAFADADGDGDSDGADFLAWQRQIGSGIPLTAASTAVPEPSVGTLGLCCLAIVLGGPGRAARVLRTRFGEFR